MKKFLSILLFVAVVLTSFVFPSAVHAQNPPAAPAPTSPQDPGGSRWVVDPEVTFIGKNAARAGLMLDWTLQNYNWVCVNRLATGQCDDSKNPLAQFWGKIVVFIVVPMLFLVILITAGVIIITRGKSLTIMRFLPRFVAVILLIVFSYSILQFLYQFTDLIQGFFLRSNIDKDICPPNCISQKDLLYVGWDYEKFIGLRLLGDYNSESAFISLLLTKLTALTYFVMVGILLIRKIILWFFIIVAPIFPILLLFYPVRNTGKIWIGEFFRWLLYAPLFAIFLQGLVSMWRTQIPLIFKPTHGEVVGKDIIYPTAVNILLGGPQQFVTTTNSVNLTETFALYVVALIMLWIVILLPWILLQIFLDYASNFSPGDSTVMKSLVNMANKQIAPVGPSGYPPGTPPGGGAAITLPFAKKFAVPVSMQPGGAAKEIVRDAATASHFATPISLPVAQVQTQSLKLANVPLPTMRDIAKYDTALISNDQSRQQEVKRVRDTLEKIANPVAVTSTVEKERFQSIHDKLGQESQQGNLLATSILNAVSTVSRQSVKASTSQVKNTMQQIANPASATNIVDRQKLTKLHDALSKESKENNNQLAKSILSVNQNTSDKEIEQIREKLEQAHSQNNPIARSVMSNINSVQQKDQKTTQVKNVLQQMTNPQSVTSVTDREKLTKLKDNLTQASKEGNQLASSILAVTDKTSNAEIEKLQERIREAKVKGEPIANQVAAITQKAGETSLPAVNRVQTVNKEDYDAVRSMWKENYQNLEVPQGMAGSRTEWIKDDIAKIDSIVGLLSSADQEKVEEGMQEVSNILPFLLVGGFSQTEIIAYLKAKQDAAKEIVTVLAQDEEQKVSVETHAQHAEKTMAASMDTSSGGGADDEDSSPLGNISMSTTNIVQPQVSNEILALVDLKLPKMRDIVRYETRALKKDDAQVAEAQKVNSVLEKVANPSMVTDAMEREKYTKLREKLLEESGKGNITAGVILSAAAGATKTEAPMLPGRTKTVLSQIANPASVVSEAEKKRYEELHDKLKKASEEGNELAKEILSTQQATPLEDIQKLNAKLKEAKDKGESVASSVLSSLSEPSVSDPSNRLQAVSDEDYDEVRKLWEENYRNLPVPQPFTGDVKGRIEWIKDDAVKVQHTVELLASNELEKRNEGMKQVAEILPFLLLGGFSNEEMVGYLKAKLDAANTVSADLQKQEESQVHVEAGSQQADQAKEMHQDIEKKE